MDTTVNLTLIVAAQEELVVAGHVGEGEEVDAQIVLPGAHREVARVWGVLGYSPTSALSKIPFEAIRAKVERVLMAATA